MLEFGWIEKGRNQFPALEIWMRINPAPGRGEARQEANSIRFFIVLNTTAYGI